MLPGESSNWEDSDDDDGCFIAIIPPPTAKIKSCLAGSTPVEFAVADTNVQNAPEDATFDIVSGEPYDYH